MKNFFYYQSLPDSMPVEDVANEFHELLIEKPFSGKSKFDFLQALLELSDRQWHTYEQLCESLKTQIEKTLINEWDGFDFDFAQGAIVVAAHLGLAGLFDFISSQNVSELSSEVAIEIKEAIAELGSNIADPYSGMKLIGGDYV
ncbi:hypothetical protein LOY43_11670 [Pseudomonas sp. B21-041]|jgi:hypothetical protein|nr:MULTISPECIES: hypothetical protein [Pseudomonas]PIF52679.1 hypothetical protein CLU80_5162 [Pseudomonas sp. 29]UVL37049.1 hypothetical protein LOY43_11670 [Pseudomonas sp. B21-041]WPN77037.1 hypothetical protein QMK46_11925 [Pseudomonas germanica]